jgi:LPXTG-motif cell wall-anchored protein
MTTTTAERITWPLYAGLGALALVAVAGVVVSRRRAAVR